MNIHQIKEFNRLVQAEVQRIMKFSKMYKKRVTEKQAKRIALKLFKEVKNNDSNV